MPPFRIWRPYRSHPPSSSSSSSPFLPNSLPPSSLPHPLAQCLADPTRATINGERYSVDAHGPPPFNALAELHSALHTMQDRYFEVWVGTWPASIDWTGAVLGMHVAAVLDTLSRSADYVMPVGGAGRGGSGADIGEGNLGEGARVENEINKYFSHELTYYFGENAFSLRQQAYDDMLWVVLGWLEAVGFIKGHAGRHYAGGRWYGEQFVQPFAHRARVFYELAAQGWDETLCGGGMTWNPNLTPYKNAITNELFVAASVGMYLDFPGDRNASPFWRTDAKNTGDDDAGYDADADGGDDGRAAGGDGFIVPPLHRPHLAAAERAYAWLRGSNMTTADGLFADGFHVSGWGRNGSVGTGKCDVRNEMVYTYNQGVLLSGLRGLWEGTGRRGYLEDGHELVRSVIRATGWRDGKEEDGGVWEGLGRNGVLEEVCDSTGSCSQNAQAFKGIFFHHLTRFCAPLPRVPRAPGKTYAADAETAALHRASCAGYAGWVARNARAAMGTRDGLGRYGMWWGADGGRGKEVIGVEGEDYRNEGVNGSVWGGKWDVGVRGGDEVVEEGGEVGPRWDWNDRGRGRTVETQGGGVAVLRAMWEFVWMYSDVQC
ncbi:Six-hairpin glycosidase [Trichodelitschia bisporula]|uniref:Six-hairpin glycosidase n=1 Tax=Trichodelitschia bisporula TaxID=703511 RepID=A0A6G1I7I7_9PEZI|nr:Six-hairpin glycosidase [Trichodelitschia bisporula]